ncbi:PilN domain-containing protein [Gemmobacter nectariphilus]|uniref:PilN domain-containing protein n=1 Tax=Gemmobacter nectariphilus TaxID=220343 RepID=UPI0004261E46|nr:PilN domain-containing protein [Gemmobacter nectariphilus]
MSDARKMRNTFFSQAAMDALSSLLVLFRPGFPNIGQRRIEVDLLPITGEALAGQKRRRRGVVAVLSRGLCLKREIQLPKAARSKASTAIALQMKASLPMNGQGLTWRYRLAGREGGQDRYSVYIVKDVQVTDLVLQLKQGGIGTASVVIEGIEDAPVWEHRSVAPQTMRNWAAATALGGVLISTFTVIQLERSRLQIKDALDARLANIARLEERLTRSRAQSDTRQERLQAVGKQLDQFRAGSRPLTLLGSLGADLPEGAWLSEVSIHQNTLRISGFSRHDVTELVQHLQGLDWAAHVKLDGPVGYDSFTRQSRFDLTIALSDREAMP